MNPNKILPIADGRRPMANSLIMDRRDALKNLAALLGAALTPATIAVISSGCQSAGPAETQLSEKQQQMVTEMADIIIPTTSTPGARAAGVGPFITMMVNDCYPEEVRRDFIAGVDDLEKKSKAQFDDSFLKLERKQQEAVVATVAEETASKKSKSRTEKTVNPSFFKLMKDLTVLGYFTSEIGATKALDYVAVPGRYDACIDLQSSKKTWAI